MSHFGCQGLEGVRMEPPSERMVMARLGWYMSGLWDERGSLRLLRSFRQRLHVEILSTQTEVDRAVQTLLDRHDVFFADGHRLLFRDLVPSVLEREGEIILHGTLLLA